MKLVLLILAVIPLLLVGCDDNGDGIGIDYSKGNCTFQGQMWLRNEQEYQDFVDVITEYLRYQHWQYGNTTWNAEEFRQKYPAWTHFTIVVPDDPADPFYPIFPLGTKIEDRACGIAYCSNRQSLIPCPAIEDTFPKWQQQYTGSCPGSNTFVGTITVNSREDYLMLVEVIGSYQDDEWDIRKGGICWGEPPAKYPYTFTFAFPVGQAFVFSPEETELAGRLSGSCEGNNITE
jgi:hypothetical protein